MSQNVAGTPERRKSLRLYASHVFKQSSVGVVSAIASTGSVPKKVFRALVFLIFTAGFLYQCIKFLSYVLEYPTIVTIDIKRPTSYLHPAFTFCNYNRIKRSEFCAKHPDFCTEPSSEFCELHPFYCSENSTVPKEEYYLNPFPFEESIFRELFHEVDNLLVTALGINLWSERPQGPFFRYRDDGSGEDEISACFSLFSRVNSNIEPEERKVGLFPGENEIFLQFDPEETEKFNPYSPSGVMFSIHPQYESINPFDKGIFLKPAHLYKIHLIIEEEKLLPYPYKSNCFNYTERWLQNNKTGPRSQQICEKQCYEEVIFICFQCAWAESSYSEIHKICTKEDYEVGCADENVDKYLKCLESCGDDCLKQKFSYQIEEREATPVFIDGSIAKESRHIKVFVETKESEMITLEYKPQYQEVEAFSYIGGFIGIWLGISLVQVADFLESTFRIIAYFLRRGSKCAFKCCSV